MNKQSFKNIVIEVESGSKYQTVDGVHAIKDGIKSGAKHQIKSTNPTAKLNSSNKPRFTINTNNLAGYQAVKHNVKQHKLATVCEEAKCPNINECWSHGTATIMLLGSVCTRACRFCSVDTGNPRGRVDSDEPQRTADSVKLMNLNYIVLTSVDRDDLPDGGAGQYAEAIRLIKQNTPEVKVEALIPDFQGDESSIDQILASGVDVFAHNLETVARLTPKVRDPRASYRLTLKVLRYAKQANAKVLTKSSLMLGLGEAEDEVLQAMEDLRAVEVDIVTLGQYLQPTRHHLSVSQYLSVQQFDAYRQAGLAMGFLEVAAGPLVRSSYRADKVFAKNNLGLE